MKHLCAFTFAILALSLVKSTTIPLTQSQNDAGKSSGASTGVEAEGRALKDVSDLFLSSLGAPQKGDLAEGSEIEDPSARQGRGLIDNYQDSPEEWSEEEKDCDDDKKEKKKKPKKKKPKKKKGKKPKKKKPKKKKGKKKGKKKSNGWGWIPAPPPPPPPITPNQGWSEKGDKGQVVVFNSPFQKLKGLKTLFSLLKNFIHDSIRAFTRLITPDLDHWSKGSGDKGNMGWGGQQQQQQMMKGGWGQMQQQQQMGWGGQQMQMKGWGQPMQMSKGWGEMKKPEMKGWGEMKPEMKGWGQPEMMKGWGQPMMMKGGWGSDRKLTETKTQ